MIASLAAWLVARRPDLTIAAARRLVKIGLAIAAVLAIAGGFALWLHLHDAGVVERHETRRELEEARTAIESEHRATGNGAVRDEARTAAAEQTKQELERIHAEDPEAAAAPASRGTRAVAKRLPLQR